MRTAGLKGLELTRPALLEKTRRLLPMLRALEPWELESRLKINPQLAMKAFSDFQEFESPGGESPALLSYHGLAYQNLEAESLGLEDFAFAGGSLAGAVWGCIPGLVKAFLNINEVLACIMTNWIAANLVTWIFDISNLKNVVENTKSGYIYKTTFNNVATSKMGLDVLFPDSQVNGGIVVAIILAIIIFIILTRTTFGYQLKACGSNRFAARYAGIKDKRNIVLSMAIAGGLAGGGAALYYLSGNTEFFWSTYQTLPAEGFNGIPVALLAVNNPIAVIFTAIFMSVLDIAGLQMTNLTAYNEYITDVIIAAIVYLSAFSLVIRMLLDGRKKKRKSGDTPADDAPVEPAQSLGDPDLHPDPAITDPDAEAPVAEGGEQA